MSDRRSLGHMTNYWARHSWADDSFSFLFTFSSFLLKFYAVGVDCQHLVTDLKFLGAVLEPAKLYLTFDSKDSRMQAKFFFWNILMNNQSIYLYFSSTYKWIIINKGFCHMKFFLKEDPAFHLAPLTSWFLHHWIISQHRIDRSWNRVMQQKIATVSAYDGQQKNEIR